MKKDILILIIVLFSVTSCDKFIEPDDILSLKRHTYLGNELLLDGIYYTEESNFEGIYYQRYALYRNGIIRDLGASKTIDDPNFLSGNSKADWGVFRIDGAIIKFERWYPRL